MGRTEKEAEARRLLDTFVSFLVGAGARSVEAERLTWNDVTPINSSLRTIEVTFWLSKTNSGKVMTSSMCITSCEFEIWPQRGATTNRVYHASVAPGVRGFPCRSSTAQHTRRRMRGSHASAIHGAGCAPGPNAWSRGATGGGDAQMFSA